LSALSSVGVVSYNTAKGNAGGYLDSLIFSNSATAFTDVTGVAPPITGDFNHNGIVDMADYVVWRNGLGTTYTQNDYNTWRANFGKTAASGTNAFDVSAIPEPATLWPLLLALSLLLYPTRH
jgi:hypothetical protein